MATPLESNTEALQTLLEAVNSLPTGSTEELEARVEALETTVSDKADSDHTHTEYADVNHAHTEYADADHTHSEYFNATTGGSIGGDTNVNGVFRVQGAQMIYYDEAGAKSQTFGTNNATGGTTICCGASANMTLNGANVKGPNLLPRATGTFTLGDSSTRWNGIYSTTAVNVSSDARMKRDIEDLNSETLAEFINGLRVVSYNYKTDSEDENARIGLIAQEVCAVDPGLAKFIVQEDDNGMLCLRPADLVFPLISAVQYLTKKVAELEAKLG